MPMDDLTLALLKKLGPNDRFPFALGLGKSPKESALFIRKSGSPKKILDDVIEVTGDAKRIAYGTAGVDDKTLLLCCEKTKAQEKKVREFVRAEPGVKIREVEFVDDALEKAELRQAKKRFANLAPQIKSAAADPSAKDSVLKPYASIKKSIDSGESAASINESLDTLEKAMEKMSL